MFYGIIKALFHLLRWEDSKRYLKFSNEAIRMYKFLNMIHLNPNTISLLRKEPVQSVRQSAGK